MDDLTHVDHILDPGPPVGPTYAELMAAVAAAGNPYAEGHGDRILAALPRHYSAAEIAAALDGAADVPIGAGAHARAMAVRRPADWPPYYTEPPAAVGMPYGEHRTPPWVAAVAAELGQLGAVAGPWWDRPDAGEIGTARHFRLDRPDAGDGGQGGA